MLIGLTGGIGTGKSTVSRILLKKGYAIIDADEIARSVVQPGKAAYKKIRQEFGDEFFVEEDGSNNLDREKLGSLIFSDLEKRKKLNAITHSEVAKQIVWDILIEMIKFNRIIFLDIPLLFETGADRYVKKTLVIKCDEEIQIERIMHRDGINTEEAKKRIDAQMKVEEKARRADYVIENSGDLGTLEEQVDKVLKSIESEWKWLAAKWICTIAITIVAIYVVIPF